MNDRCTLCAVLNGELEPNDVPLEYLQASGARMVTHFVTHPSVALGTSIARLFALIAEHGEVLEGVHGPRHYRALAKAWQEIVTVVEAREGNGRPRAATQVH